MIAQLVINYESYCIDVDPSLTTAQFYEHVFEYINSTTNLKNSVRMHIFHNGKVVCPSTELHLGDIASEALPMFYVRYYYNVERPKRLVLLENGAVLLIY